MSYLSCTLCIIEEYALLMWFTFWTYNNW